MVRKPSRLRGRVLFLLAAFGGCLMDVKRYILRRSLHESRSLL